MSEVKHAIERLSDRLADRMLHEADLLARFLTPPGARPPFTQRVDLAWWRANRMRPEVMAYLSETMAADEIMNLDSAISEQIEAERMAPPLVP